MKKIMLTAALCGFMFAASAQSETKQDKSLAKVDKVDVIGGSLYVFTNSTPVTDYEVLGIIKLPAMVKNGKSDEMVSIATKRGKKQYPNCEAVVITGKNFSKARAIKFK